MIRFSAAGVIEAVQLTGSCRLQFHLGTSNFSHSGLAGKMGCFVWRKLSFRYDHIERQNFPTSQSWTSARLQMTGSYFINSVPFVAKLLYLKVCFFFFKLFLKKMQNLPLRTAFLIVVKTCFCGPETKAEFHCRWPPWFFPVQSKWPKPFHYKLAWHKHVSWHNG